MRTNKYRVWNELDGVMIDKSNTARLVDGCLICDPEETLLEYTGLKDKNSVEICEGDIVKTGDFDGGQLCEVKFGRFVSSHESGYSRGHFHQGWFLFKDGAQAFGGSDEDIYINDLIVVGNIHENPELLEDKS